MKVLESDKKHKQLIQQLSKYQISKLVEHYNDRFFYHDISVKNRIELIISFCTKKFDIDYRAAKNVVIKSKIKNELIEFKG